MSKGERVPYEKAWRISGWVVTEVAMRTGIHILVAGSVRRKRPDCGDIDFVCSAENWPEVSAVLPEIMEQSEYKKKDGSFSHGYVEGLKCEFYVGPERGLGALLQFATGSANHNIRTRRAGMKNGFKVSQYGIFSRVDNEFLGGKDEEEFYALLGMKVPDPETEREH